MNLIKKISQVAFLFVFMFSFFACQEKDNIVTPTSGGSVFKQLVESDDDILSFEPNYNEEDAMSFLGKLSKTVYPVKIGQNMKLVSRDLQVDSSAETAIGVLTEIFDGKLIIAGSFSEPTNPMFNKVDTVITKNFSTTVVRKIKFERVNSSISKKNWRIVSVSLPQGGTDNQSVKISKMIVTLPNGDTIDVTSPNDYWLDRFPGVRHQIPVINRGQGVTLTVEVKSLYDGEDFISLTFGAIRGQGHHRTKAKFDLVSSEFDGTYYNKVYTQTWNEVMQPMGHKHAIVNALPMSSVNDTETPVEENSWGMPYIIK
ncbi:MAG: hypothetical protein Fur0015_12730 [Ignavibacteriales bacterium]